MLLLLLFCLIYETTGKLHIFDKTTTDANDLDINKNHLNIGKGVLYIIGDPLWVLRLHDDDWLDPKLRLGTFEEEKDFYHAAGPEIRRLFIRRALSRVKKDNPEPPANVSQTATTTNNQTISLNNNLKADILKTVNKFIVTTSVPPDSYGIQDGDGDTPSIALYFKGPITYLLIKLGPRQWHINLKDLPFPAWFYEPHDTFEAPLKLPEDVKNPFFSALLGILKLVLFHSFK